MSDVTPQWLKSSFCGTSGCVEVAKVADQYLVRDSKVSDSPILSFDQDEWTAFLRGIDAGEFRFN
jgi:hypothetical protein